MLENIQTMKTVNVEKKIVHKLVKESTENVEEVRLAKMISAQDENKHKGSPFTLYTVFTFNVGIGTYFVYFHWFKNKKVIFDLKETTIY